MKIPRIWKVLIVIGVLCLVAFLVLITQYKWVTTNDKNEDGQIDEWTQFNFKGQKVEFKRDKNFDGKPDYVEHFQEDRVYKTLVDFDYDGFFETTGTWARDREVLILLERDLNADGKPDRRTIYDPNTGLPQIKEEDTDFDGTFDKTLDVSKQPE